MFDYPNEEVRRLHIDLILATDGSEPCYDKAMMENGKLTDSPTDLYVENWTEKGLSPAAARALCDGCHVFDQCKTYAMAAREPNGVWAGTLPSDRLKKKVA